MHIHTKQKVLEEQRLLGCTWPLPGIQNTEYFEETTPPTTSHNAVVAWRVAKILAMNSPSIRQAI